MASIVDVIRPKHMSELLDAMASTDLEVRALAGGTDLLLKYQDQAESDLTLVDLTGVPTLSGVGEQPDAILIGAATRLDDVIRSTLVAEHIPVLIEGAVVVAGPQVRNLATIGGNVCNASPSADTIPPLLVLGAQARLVSATGRRSVPLDEFFTGPGQTVLEPGELLESLWVPRPVPGTVASYSKLSPRRAMDLAIVGVAVSLWEEGSGIESRIALGAVAPTPIRATAAESIVNGRARITPELAVQAGKTAAEGISPISDVRGGAAYRTSMVERLVTRQLSDLGERLAAVEVS